MVAVDCSAISRSKSSTLQPRRPRRWRRKAANVAEGRPWQPTASSPMPRDAAPRHEKSFRPCLSSAGEADRELASRRAAWVADRDLRRRSKSFGKVRAQAELGYERKGTGALTVLFRFEHDAEAQAEISIARLDAVREAARQSAAPARSFRRGEFGAFPWRGRAGRGPGTWNNNRRLSNRRTTRRRCPACRTGRSC